MRLKPLRHTLFCIVLLSTSPTIFAEWLNLANDKTSKANLEENQLTQQFIDLDNVKQAGPMAIYRQVMILSQGADQPRGALSTVSLYEYDCMNSKLRILKTSSFSEEWAKGETLILPPTLPGLGEWANLPNSILGKKTFDLVCPTGR